MATYIECKQTINELPFLDKEWYYVFTRLIFRTSIYRQHIENNLTSEQRKLLELDRVSAHSYGTYSYPRFDAKRCLYKIIRNELNIYPTHPISLSFSDICDNRSLEILEQATNYEKVYCFYSGGLDSTTLLTSILKNWNTQDLEKLIVVLNEHSIGEYPLFYETYIKDKLNTISTNLFYSSQLLMNEKHLYVTGEPGGYTLAPICLKKYDSLYPNSYLQDWQSNKDKLILFYDNNINVFEEICSLLPKHFVTVFDFLFWVTFNYNYTASLYYLPIMIGKLDAGVDVKSWVSNNNISYYNTVDFQNWAMYTPTDVKIGTIDEIKLPMRKYILDFTNDMSYYLTKTIVPSTSKNSKFFSRVPIGIDSDYNIYYRNVKWLK